MIAFYENRKTDFSVRDLINKKGKLGCSAHLHYHIELVLMVEGETEAFADTERCTIRAGDAFIAFPNQIHRYVSSGPERFLIFIINPNLLPGLTETFTDCVPRQNVLRSAANDPEIKHLADRLLATEGENGRYESPKRQGYLLALFSALLERTELTKAASGESHTLKAIISYCMQNYQNELSLSVLERDLHISKYYISHLFSDKLRIGFNDYINSLRVSFACHYLRHTSKPVTEIGSLVGFGTSRTFNRAFIKQMGQTPSKYRQSADKK